MAQMTIVILSLALSAFAAVDANTMVTGMVFCDQCKYGSRSIFDYPLYAARVALQCGGGTAPVTVSEDTTNWLGGFSVRLEGAPDLNGCTARVVEGPARCGAGFGPPQELSLTFRMLGIDLYTVAPLLSQPGEPMDFCPGRERRAPPMLPPLPPLVRSPPVVPRMLPPPLPPVWHMPPLPPVWHLPPSASHPPPLPVAQGSACTSNKWLMPEYKCYWKVVSPDTTVELAFGAIAAARYGMDMTLREGLIGRGDAYRTLLREATTALLNSYNSPGIFFYPTLTVIDHMNRALVGSTRQALVEAVRFKRANSGGAGRVRQSCTFSPCSS